MLAPSIQVRAEEEPTTPVEIIYKQVTDSEGDRADLSLHVFFPDDWDEEDDRPVIVFFFGGGWNSGTPAQFYPHCRSFAELGVVAISAEYRVASRHGTKPIACVEDGRSAVRYLRAHSDNLGIDPDRVIAGGGSAGGHVAACTALIDDVNADTEDQDISAIPNAIVLMNPVLDTTRATGYGSNRMGDDDQRLSPVHRVYEGQPPSIIFHGTGDRTVPIDVARRFVEASHEVEATSELVEYDGLGHGFFNHPQFRRNNDPEIYDDIMERTIAFLDSLDLLDIPDP